jgi:hypothetical protein
MVVPTNVQLREFVFCTNGGLPRMLGRRQPLKGMNMMIDEEVQKMGPLRNTAAAIVDFVGEAARLTNSEFRCHGYEWTLEPDNWINLRFSARKKHIHISLGVWPDTLEDIDGLEVKPGKYPQWCKITISRALELPQAMRCIEFAYYAAGNRYRNANGKPKPLAAQKAMAINADDQVAM